MGCNFSSSVCRFRFLGLGLVSSGRVGSKRRLVLGFVLGALGSLGSLGVVFILFIGLGGMGSPSSSPSSLSRLVKWPNSLDKGLMLALMMAGG